MLLYCVFTLHCNKCSSLFSCWRSRFYLVGEIETHCFWCTEENVLTSGKHVSQRPEWDSIFVKYRGDRKIISGNLKTVFPNFEIALHDGDQLYTRSFFFETKMCSVAWWCSIVWICFHSCAWKMISCRQLIPSK